MFGPSNFIIDTDDGIVIFRERVLEGPGKMEEGKRKLITALNTSVKELQQGVDLHCRLLNSVLQGNNEKQDLLPIWDPPCKQSQEQMMRQAINEAIEELEESRKAFKSKKLEALRKKLTQVLINTH